jgi:plasmid stability protein
VAVNLSVKDVPDDLAQRLRERAERNHRSLQGELMFILTQAVEAVPALASPGRPMPSAGALPSGDPSRCWLQGWKTLEHLAAERRASGWKPHPSLAQAPLAVDIVRADRDSR